MGDFTREYAVVSRLLWDVGADLRDSYGKPGTILYKADGTPVTEIDKAASARICAVLEQEFPGDGIVDEERGTVGADRPRVWYVDPLDGTKEWIGQTGDYGVLVGLEQGGRPVFGMTYRPQTDELAFARRGNGAYLLHASEVRALRVSDDAAPRIALVTRSRRGPEVEALLDAVRPAEVRPMGSALKIVEVAKGNAMLTLLPRGSHMSLWDLCAPTMILEGAGGQITDLSGRPFVYRGADTKVATGILATNGRMHDLVLARIAAAGLS